MIEPESITFTNNPFKLYVGPATDDTKPKATVLPTDAYDKTLRYRSEDPDIVAIDGENRLIGVSYGEATVVATAINGVEGRLQVKVYDVTTDIMAPDEIVVKIGEKYQLEASTLPETSDGYISYRSTNAKIAKVSSNGLVEGVAAGECYINLQSSWAFNVTDKSEVCSKECLVRVVKPVTGIELSRTEETMKAGNTLQLKATITPADAWNTKVNWSSSDETVAIVNSEGIVIALKPGNVEIIARADDDENIVAKCSITVLQPVTGIQVIPESVRFTSIGDKIQLEASVLPEDASNKAVKWGCSNNAVCVVSPSGLVVATGRGDAVVMATSEDGGYMAICLVNVTTMHKLTYFVDSDEYYSETLEYNSYINPIAEPQKEGYIFSGWSNIPTRMPAEDVNVYGTFMSGIDDIVADTQKCFNVYNLQGQLLKADATKEEIAKLNNGLYIINGQKVYIRKR